MLLFIVLVRSFPTLHLWFQIPRSLSSRIDKNQEGERKRRKKKRKGKMKRRRRRRRRSACFAAAAALPPLPLLLPPPSTSAAAAFVYCHCPCSCRWDRVMSTLRYKGSHTHMDRKASLIEEEGRKRATLRLSNISSFKAELLEIRSEDPSLHIFLVPGNPGVVSFYKDFVEEVFELLDGNASITAIGHTSHTGKYLDFGRLFSLQDQINHKVDLIKQEVANKEIPIILVGHSIGSYISLEIFKRLPQQVKYYIGLYPFMAMNEKSSVQSRLVKITASSILRGAVSFSIALLGLLPNSASELLVRNLIGQSWSTTAVEAACTRLLRFHTMQNVLYMAMTEFQKFQLSEDPDWTFMREKREQIAFLFGDDDHWGPLTLYEQICKQVPDVAISIEREGHTHAFSCTEAGSIWVAHHVVNLIRNQTSS